MTSDHFEYPMPFNDELNATYPKVYRVSSELMESIEYTFRHPFNKYNKSCNTHFNRDWTIANDMGRAAVQLVREYLAYPQRYGHSMQNVEAVILFRMWRQYIKHMIIKDVAMTEYMPVKLKMLKIENGLFEMLLREVTESRYVQSGDDMVKKRPGKGLREHAPASMQEGSKHFEHLCSLE